MSRHSEHKPAHPKHSGNTEMPGREAVVMPKRGRACQRAARPEKTWEAMSNPAKLKYSRSEKEQRE